MALSSGNGPTRRRRRRSRIRRLGTVLGAAALLATTACGFGVQTNQPYTPAVGVNGDYGPSSALKIRDLKILSAAPGQGFLSGSMTSSQPETLTGVQAIPVKPDGSRGAPVTATVASPVKLEPGVLVVLTDQPLIRIDGPDLLAGLEAQLDLQFSQVGKVTLITPVVDGNQAEFRTISPSPAPSSG